MSHTASPARSVSLTPAMARMRGALDEIVRTDPQLGRHAAAYDLVEVSSPQGPVIAVGDAIRFDASLAEHITHGETVSIIAGALETRILRHSPSTTAH